MNTHEKQGVGASVEWLTPQWCVEMFPRCDLDPCGCEGQADTADTVYMLPEQDGRLLPWFGDVWLNPPYGTHNVTPFMERMTLHNSGVALIPARTGVVWFQRYVFGHAAAVFFPRGRIRFGKGRHDNIGKDVAHESCFAIYGRDFAARAEATIAASKRKGRLVWL